MVDEDLGDKPIDYAKLEQLLEQGLNKDAAERYQLVVNAPFTARAEMAFLFLGIIMLLFVDEKRQALQAKAVAQTEFSDNIDQMAVMPVDAIFIPLNAKSNLLVKAIKSGEPEGTTDWSTLLHPVLDAEKARFTQASGGIAYTAVYPLHDAKGALVYSFFRRQAGDMAGQDDFMQRYTELVDKSLAA
jgi:hypothetical protein